MADKRNEERHMKKTRMIVNVGMTIVLLGLMSYSLIGNNAASR